MFDKDPGHIPLRLSNTGIVSCCTEPYIYIQEIGSGTRCYIDRIFRKSFAPVCRDTNYRTGDPGDRKVRNYAHD